VRGRAALEDSLSVLFHLIQVLSTDGLMIAIVFLIALALLVFAFARERSGALLLGLAGYIGWIFSSPFIYVKKTVEQIASTRDEPSSRDPGNEQYLISRLLLISRGAVVAVALVILASSVATGWEDFLPSKWLRVQDSFLSRQLSNFQTQADSTRAQIKALDDDWSSHKDELIKQHQEKRAQDASSAVAANLAIATNMAKAPATAQSLNTVRAYLDRQKHDSIPEINETRRTARNLIQELSLTDPDDLNAYVGNWCSSNLNSLPENLSPDELQYLLQPDLAPDKNRLRNLNSDLAATQQQLQNVQREEEYHPTDFLLDIVKGIFAFIFFVWCFGLLIEALLLGIFIARDVHLIRLEKCPPSTSTLPE
jgi:hypothetical protein